MTTQSKKIRPLTSLRFIAALMIFMVHTSDRLGMPAFKSIFDFGHGVSFFYVLSGFILTYVYFRPGVQLNLRTFFRKRFFRLYPLHIFTFIAALLLIPLVQETLGRRIFQVPLQLTMTQSWLGTRYAAFGFNGPAWSISTEFGFYILFPLLLKFYDRIYSVFLFYITLTITAILIAIYLDGAFADWLWQALHVHPLGRLVEFICGICVAKYFLQNPNSTWSKKTFSKLEILVIALIVVAGSLNYEINQWLIGLPNRLELTAYITRSGMFLLFGFLIWVIAQEKGFLSRLLSNKTLVFLGEISFAFYLIHQIVISFFEQNYELMVGYNPVITFISLLLLSLGFSYAAYKLIEVPFQKIGRDSFYNVLSNYNSHFKDGRALTALALTIIFGFTVQHFKPGYQSPSEETLTVFRQNSISANYEAKNADAKLTHYRFEKQDDKVCYKVLWEFGVMNHDTPVMLIVNVPYQDRRKTISNEILLVPSAWKNANANNGNKVHVLDDFCFVVREYLTDNSGNHLIRIILRQKTGNSFEPLKFQNKARPQNMLLLNCENPENFIWLNHKKK